MLQDLRFGFKHLVKTPGFTAIAVLTLAVAIGANTAMFTLINGVILRPLVPVRPDEVVNVFTARADNRTDYRPFSYREFQTVRDSQDVFADVAASRYALVGIGDGQRLRRSYAVLTSENFFDLVGTRPAQGRFYNAAESRPNAELPVVVASHQLWKRMGGRADFVGSTLQLNGRPVTVIGIAREEFTGFHALMGPDLWIPLGLHGRVGWALGEKGLANLDAPDNHALNLVARLRPGLTLDGAKSLIPAVASRMTALQGSAVGSDRHLQLQKPSRVSINTRPNRDGPIHVIATALMAMAALVLIIASLNLANMLLARAATRVRDIAVRCALGASRWHIVRQLLGEGLLLALTGGALGLLVSSWTSDLLVQVLARPFQTISFSVALATGPDVVVLAVTLGACLAATLLFSLGPALKASRTDIVTDLKQGAAQPTRAGSFRHVFAGRNLLVMAQIALSLLLLFTGGLFVRGAMAAGDLPLGFQSAGGVVAELDFSLGQQDDSATRRAAFAALERARQLPGVQSAALASLLPFGNATTSRRIMAASGPSAPTAGPHPRGTPDPGANGLYNPVSSGYFAALGIPVLQGRDFTPHEARDPNAAPVAILDELMAAKLFPDRPAVGRHIRYTQPLKDGSPSKLEVVGVVSAHRHDLFNGAQRRLFVPLALGGTGNVQLHLRLTAVDPSAVRAAVPTLHRALLAIDSSLPVLAVRPLAEVVDRSVDLWIVRLGAVLFGIFGGVALLLAMIGVYGVKSCTVAHRTREIGIRMALGAHARDVFALVMKQGALQTAVALAAGLLLALGTGHLLTRILYRVSPADPVTLAVASVALASAALLACYLPARRATRVDPMAALRND